MIIEEGFLVDFFWKIVKSMKVVVDVVGVKIVIGDIKVVF